MSEKNTERYMQEEYEKVFKHEYHTETNKELFDTKIPDGWDIIDNKILIIIECKQLVKQKNEGKEQLFNYYDMLSTDVKDRYIIYLILALGKTHKSFKYIIYNSNKQLLNKSLTDISNSLVVKPMFDVKEIHNLNQYLYDNSINLSKSQKTLFIASILICLKIDKDILDDYDELTNPYLIASKIIKTIQNYYNDRQFTNMFTFIEKSIHNKHLLYIFNMLTLDIKKYGKDILNQFYSEFCIWDRNNDASLGIVLTPHDIVELMVNKAIDYYKQYNNNNISDIKCIDFCTGTGSFLIEAGKYINNLYGCEVGDERYALCKCNFILHDLDYTNIKYNSCFNELYTSTFDISIINPPFTNKCQDELNPLNNMHWKEYNEEARFVLYQLELLKDNGIGCCIIPRSNLNNNIKRVNNFKEILLNNCQILEIINCNNKVFVPNAMVECAIVIYRKCINGDNSNVKITDYSDDGHKVLKKVRYYDHKPSLNKYQYKELTSITDWNYCTEFNIELTNDELFILISEYNNAFKYAYNNYLINQYKINKLAYKPLINDVIVFKEINEWKSYKICELMNLLPPGRIDGNKNNTNNGEYLLISTGQQNNGILKYVDQYEYDGTVHKYITVAMYGSAGSSFYQPYKFIVNHNVRVLEINNNITINPYLIALVMNNILIKKYSYTNGLAINKLMNEIINIPIFI